MAATRQGVPDTSPERDPDRPLTVAHLAGLIDDAIQDSLPARLRVVGQVSGFRQRTHWYFDLKDEHAVVSCVMFASAARRSRAVIEDGLEVVLTGRVDFYKKTGRISLIVERIEPVGAGAMELAFRRLCEELRGLGWFDERRKRSLPRFPRRVAVVTSATGAALHDVLDTARRRCPMIDIALVDVRVQGERAAPEIARALRRLGAAHERLGIDAILLTRGGGSMEDLWAFNERQVAEQIVRSPIPVVAAIGHESDTTIAELVADRRCATPTQAAVALFPDREALARELTDFAKRLRFVVDRLIAHERQRVRAAVRHRVLSDPTGPIRVAGERLGDAVRRAHTGMHREVGARARRLHALWVRLERHRPATAQARREARLEELTKRLRRAARARTRLDLEPSARRLARAQEGLVRERASRLESLDRELEAVGPGAVLRRGYSVTTRADDGALVRSPEDVRAGQALLTRLSEGSVESVVGGVRQSPSVPAPSRRPRRGGGRSGADDPSQMDLFE